MLGNESNASRRSLNGANSADALPELLAGAGSGGRTRKRRLEEDGDAADPQALDNAIRAVESVYKDLESHSRGPTGIVGFTGATDLVNQLQDSVSSLALLWKPSPENDTRLDDIDAIASGIWNLSINSKVDNEVPGHSTAKQLVAELRSAAYTLIELCETQKEDVNALLKLLTLATKVGKSFFNNGDHKKAADAYHRASLIYEKISSLSVNYAKTKSMSNIYQPFLVLCLQRAELSFEMGNNHNAHHLISRALDRTVFSFAKPAFLENLAETEIEFARRLIARGEYLDAAKWARKALELVESDEESENVKLAKEVAAPLRHTALKLLATAYIYSGVQANLELAGNAIELAQQTAPHDAGLYYLLQKKQSLEGNADEAQVLKLCDAALKNVDLKDQDAVSIVTSMLHQGAETCGKRSMLKCFRILTERARGAGHSAWVEKLLCATCNLLTNQVDAQISVEESCRLLQEVYSEEVAHGLQPSAATTSSCQLMLWRAGDEAFESGKFQEALAYFETSKQIQHQTFDLVNQQILLRRIAECNIKLSDFPGARKAIAWALDQTPVQPSTLRILFDINLQESHLEECAKDIEAMTKGEDSASVIGALGHAASSASQHPMGSRLVSLAIKSLIDVHRNHLIPIGAKLLSLYRKLIKLNEEASATPEDAARTNMGLFEETVGIVQAADFQPTEAEQLEVKYLAKLCWNAALFLHNDTEHAAKYLDLAHSLLCKAREMSSESESADYWQRSLVAALSTAAACVNYARELSDDKDARLQALKAALDRVRQFKTSLDKSPFKDSIPADTISAKLLLIEFEARLGLKQYQEIQTFLTNIGEEVHWTTLELMVDLALKSDETPSGVQFLVIQVTLDAILRQDEIDAGQFATWMRVLIITACNKNHASALQFFGQILDVINETYPETEVEWLISKAWNIGVDAMAAGDQKKAQTWCEMAMRFLPRLQTARARYEPTMVQTYGKILEMAGPAQV